MHILLSFAVVLFAANQVVANTVETLKLKTPRGVEIEAVIHYPDTKAPVPVVVIGSGQGYHMDLPLTKGLAEKVVDKGYAAIRFNWHYHTEGGNPSKDLINEQEDFATAVNFVKNNTRIDADKIVVAGKSLGTFVSYRHFDTDNSVKALVLMTPICTWYWDDNDKELPKPIPVGQKNYPRLLTATRPVVIAMGNRDPICSVPMMHDFMKGSSGNIASIVVEGDHSMNIGKRDDPAYKSRNAENVGAATDMISHWVRLIINNL